MAITRIQVKNYNALGNLFIEWALDKNKRPATLAGFIEAVVDTDIVAPLPKYIDTFGGFVQCQKNELLLRLPPAELVKDTLDSIENGDDYFLPPFYAKRIGGELDNNREFFGFRVGDYVIAHCS